MSDTQRSQWSSQLAFVMSAIGSAVGLGNIWRFPYMMGKNGGAIFLVVYLLLIFTVCSVPLICEMAFGKFTQKGSVKAFETVNPKFKIFGWIHVVTVIMIAAFYFVVGGWILKYLWMSVSSTNVSDYSSYFSAFTSQSLVPCLLTAGFLSACSVFTYRGINKGVELANNIMMPLFAVFLVALAFVSLQLPGAEAGLTFMFKPDFSKFSGTMVLQALGQALFTLSIGMGALIAYGSYLDKKADIVKSAYCIICADTLFAVLAGVMIFPAVFTFGVEPTSGAGLVFITLPKIFAKMAYGNFFAFIFFILLLFAALTSGISMLEVSVKAFMENFELSRHKSTVLTFLIILTFALPVTLSFGVLNNLKVCQMTLFDLFDFVSSNLFLPLNTLIICLVVGWLLNFKKDYIFKNRFLYKLFMCATKYIVPTLLLILLVFGLIK